MILGRVHGVNKNLDELRRIDFEKTVKDSLLDLKFNEVYKNLFEHDFLKKLAGTYPIKGQQHNGLNGIGLIVEKTFLKSSEGVFRTEWDKVDYNNDTWNVRYTILETNNGNYLDLEIQPDTSISIDKFLENSEFGKMFKAYSGMLGGMIGSIKLDFGI